MFTRSRIYTILGVVIFVLFVIVAREVIAPTVILSEAKNPSINKQSDPSASPQDDKRGIAASTAELSEFPTDTVAYVKRVVDGDTIVIEEGQGTGMYVRYIGMNTPESVDPRKPYECFGHEAAEYNKSLVLNKTVRLVKDVSETDKYGRLLRYVYLPD